VTDMDKDELLKKEENDVSVENNEETSVNESVNESEQTNYDSSEVSDEASINASEEEKTETLTDNELSAPINVAVKDEYEIANDYNVHESHVNPYYGEKCEKCNVAFGDNDKVVVCDTCGAKHHSQCWSDNDRCSVAGCDGQIDINSSYLADAQVNNDAISSPFAGLICSYCHMPFGPTDKVAECDECGTLLHTQCWEDNGGCTKRMCEGKMKQNTSQSQDDWQPQDGSQPQDNWQTQDSSQIQDNSQIQNNWQPEDTENDNIPVVVPQVIPPVTPSVLQSGTQPVTPDYYVDNNADNNVYSGAVAEKKKFPLKKMLLIYGGVAAAVVLIIGVLFATKVLCIHKWQAPTCTTPEVCMRCEKERGEPIDHDWSAGSCKTPKTCKVCGEKSGTALGHSWINATCTTPKTCSRCGEIEGKVLDHSWEDATCEKPETCSRCAETKGKAKGHKWKDATCTEPKTCSRCKKTDGKAKGHKWKDATVDDPKTCTECGKTEGSRLDFETLGIGVIITDDASGLNMRKKPDVNADRVTTMSETGIVYLYESNTPGWYYVKYDGCYGYAKSEYIIKISEAYSGSSVSKVISADIDNDNVFEVVVYYGSDVRVYDRNGSNDSYYATSNKSYHVVEDYNTGDVYLAEYISYDSSDAAIQKIYPYDDVVICYGYSYITKNTTKEAFEKYIANIVFVDDYATSGSQYNSGHWVDFGFTVN